MAHIDVDVAELRSFIGKYRVAAAEIDSIKDQLVDEVINLEWDDGVKKRFDDKFNQAIKHLWKFKEYSENDIRFLMDRLRKAEAYLENK